MHTIRFRPSGLGGLFAALSIAVASAASAQAGEPAETSFYGIALARPFTGMPECPKDTNYDNMYVIQANYPCYQHDKISRIGAGLGGDEDLTIMYPSGKYPEMYNGMYLHVVNGVVQGVKLITNGVASQTHDFALLVGKFGPPSSRRTIPMQNRMGATFDVIEASWQRPNGVSMTFKGVVNSLDTGQVNARTPQEVAREKAMLDEQQAGVPKL